MKLTLLQFISTSFRKKYQLSDRYYWWDKSKFFFWHFPSHWTASGAISLPFRLECCFRALIWYLACRHKLHSSKIPTKRISVESSPKILVASQYRFFSAPHVPEYWLFTKIPGFDSIGLWRFLKSKIYANKPKTIEELKNYIRGDVAEISLETLVNVMENAKKRVRFCLSNNGGHFIDVVFKN